MSNTNDEVLVTYAYLTFTLSLSLLGGLSLLGLLNFLSLRTAHALTHKHEYTLLWLVTGLLKSVLAFGCCVLLLRDNSAMLVHDKVSLLKFTLGLVRSSVMNLCTGSNEHLVCLSTNVVESV